MATSENQTNRRQMKAATTEWIGLWVCDVVLARIPGLCSEYFVMYAGSAADTACWATDDTKNSQPPSNTCQMYRIRFCFWLQPSTFAILLVLHLERS